MPSNDAIQWFKTQFHEPITSAVKGTPFTVDFLTAIACQETGSIWGEVDREKLKTDEILAICVGDTLDQDRGRRAFPRTKADLLAKPNGQKMFDVAHDALVGMAKHIPGFRKVAKNPDKFCHGYGIFQQDLQFFLTDPDYFLKKRYTDFDASLGKALEELKSKQIRIGLGGRTQLTDLELVHVAIAYNTGTFKPALGLKQGHFDGTKHYGEAVFDFLRRAQAIATNGTPAAVVAPQPGTAPLPPPTPVTTTGTTFEVDVVSDPLNVRKAPIIPPISGANVIARLPDGHLVRAVSETKQNGFLEVETSLNGALIRGFASAKFLKKVPGKPLIAVEAPSPTPPTSGITAAHLPHGAGAVTRRRDIADAHSLNEKGMPSRTGQTAEARRADLASIIEFLATDDPSHARYAPRSNFTFCNIYTHDYCHLAGVYLPRVWWNGKAIESLAKGAAVAPRLGKSVDEQRANDLFRWLRDFGDRFGWRQTGTLTKLQTEVNQGAIGLIIARRIVEGRSGHMVAVVPETEKHQAVRNAGGEVVAALQSQAGSVNFQYGTGKRDWFLGTQFAEFAFWLHA
jgi:hypothetical protein